MDDLLAISLSAAVPLWIKELQGLPWKDVAKMADESATIVASQGDTLMYKTKGKTRETFNALARGLAALSFVPGGVTFMGMHFEARHSPGERQSGGHIPRNLTFEKGTLGRFILSRRLTFDWQETAPPHRASPLSKHYIVRVIDAKGRELNTYFSKGALLTEPPNLEEVLYSMGMDSIIWEDSNGSIEAYARETGGDPDDAESQYGLKESETSAAGLRVLLGQEGYEELLAIVGQGK